MLRWVSSLLTLDVTLLISREERLVRMRYLSYRVLRVSEGLTVLVLVSYRAMGSAGSMLDCQVQRILAEEHCGRLRPPSWCRNEFRLTGAKTVEL